MILNYTTLWGAIKIDISLISKYMQKVVVVSWVGPGVQQQKLEILQSCTIPKDKTCIFYVQGVYTVSLRNILNNLK